MAPALLEELRTVATEVKRNQIENAVGSSWAAMVAKDGPQRRGIYILLVKARAGGGGWRGDGDGRGWEVGRGWERGRGC